MVEGSVDVPKDWMPLFEWQSKWHYGKQLEYIKALETYWEVVFCAGNGTGKSHILWWSAICLALGVHPKQTKLGFNAQPPLKIKALITDFEHGYGKIFTETALLEQYMPDGTVIGPMMPTSAVDKWPSRDDRTLYLKNGSFIFFQTSEQKKKLHSGTNFDILLSDEEAAENVYDESKRGLRTAKGGGRILHAYTPPFDVADDSQKGPSWTKFKLIDPFEAGAEEQDLYVVRAAMKDNPAITDDFIRKFCKGKTEEQIRVQLYGEYPTWGKMVFADLQDYMWDPATKLGHLLPWDFEVPFNDPDVLFEFALDWHPSKPASPVWTFEYLSGPNKGDVVVWDELSPKMGEGMTISQLKVAIREVEGWRSFRVRRFGDPKMKDKNNALISGFNAWDEFRHGEPKILLTEGWNRDPGMGYSVVNDYLRGKGRGFDDHPRLFIKENCKTVRHNMKNHYWVQKSDGSSIPDTKFNDYCVSLKYILQNKSRKLRKIGNDRYGREKIPITSYGDNYKVDRGTYVPRFEPRVGG